MTKAVGELVAISGETVSFALRASDPVYDGSETITCDIKPAVNGAYPPKSSVLKVLSITPVFVPMDGETPPMYLFTLTSAQTLSLGAKKYITDAKVVFISGVVDKISPLLINLSESVTQ